MKKAILILHLILLLSTLHHVIEGQDTLVIRGTVIDGITHEPIIFAYVALTELEIPTQTDLNGKFELIAEGNFSKTYFDTLKLRYTGYPEVDTVLVFNNHFKEYNKKIIDLELEMKTVEYPGTFIDSYPIVIQPNILRPNFWQRIKLKYKRLFGNK